MMAEKKDQPIVYTPVIKIVTVRANQSRAFNRFTSEMAGWWPLASHSTAGGNAETVVMENRVGGRIVERIRGGGEAVWGTITAWDPPRRVTFTWHPGDPPEKATNVDVRFVAIDAARTRVELEHVGFERLGAMAKKARRGYPIGWAYVLGLYAERKGPFMLAITGLTSALMWFTRRRAAALAVREDLT
jgi:uncharacterized protein YndB with AHSA1/START domain